MLQIISIFKFSSVCTFFWNFKLTNFVCGLKQGNGLQHTKKVNSYTKNITK